MAIETPVAIQPPETTPLTTGVTDRKSRLDGILKSSAMPADQQQKIRDTFGQKTMDRSQVESFIRALPLDSQKKGDLWDTYYTYQAPAPPLISKPEPPKTGLMDRFTSAVADASVIHKQNLAPPTVKLPVPPSPSKLTGTSFDTKLSPAEESQFKTWKAKYAPLDSGEDYDLRGAFKAGLVPDPQSGHWPDTFKKPSHPTFSNESQYTAFAPDKAGHWTGTDGETYVPGQEATPPKAVGVPPPPATGKTYFSVTDKLHPEWAPAALLPPPVPFKAQFPGIVPSRVSPPEPQSEPGLLSKETFSNIGGSIKDLIASFQNDQLKGARPDKQEYARLRREDWNQFRDSMANVVNMAGGFLKAATLGNYEPEKGKLSLPVRLMREIISPTMLFGDQKAIPPDPSTTIHRPISEVLQKDWGVPADVANNPVPGKVGEFAGILVPWEGTSSALAGALDMAEAHAVARVGARGVLDAAETESLYNTTKGILKRAGIHAATGEIIAHAEKAPENETILEREKRAGQTALAGAAFSVIFDSLVNLYVAAKGKPIGAAGAGASAEQATDGFINSVYDAFYKSGRFSDEASSRKAADRVLRAEMGKTGEKASTPPEILDAIKRRFESEKPVETPEVETPPVVEKPKEQPKAGTPEKPIVPKVEAPAEVPEVPKPTPLKNIKPPEKGVKKEPVVEPVELPPVAPESLGIVPPKKQFTHDGQNVVGIHEGKAVLADGTLVDRSEGYAKQMAAYGYKELSTEQVATLAGLGAVKAANENHADLAGLPEDVSYLGPQEGADGKLALHLYNLQQPDGTQATFGVKPGGDVVAAADEVRGQFKASEEKPAVPEVPSPSSEDLPSQLRDLEKQLETAQGLASDTSQPNDIRGEASLQVDDLLDDINVLQQKMGVPVEQTTAHSGINARYDPIAQLPKPPEAIEQGIKSVIPGSTPVSHGESQGEAWAKNFTKEWYKTSLSGPLAALNPPPEAVPSFEEARSIYAKMIDMFPDEPQTMPDMLDDLIVRRMQKRPYPSVLRTVTKALGLPQPEGESVKPETKGELPDVPEPGSATSEGGTPESVPAPIASPREQDIARYRGLADQIFDILKNGESIDNKRLQGLANAAFGGTRGEGKYDPRDAYDTAEAAINMVIRQPGFVDFDDVEGTLKKFEALEKQIPRQTDRTQEQVDFQQFSTPPAESFAAMLASGLRAGMLGVEPSAGDGNIATMMQLSGADVITNEITPRRQAILEMLGFKVHSVDAQYLNNLLPFDITPAVIVMNPPFSSTGGRTQGHKTEYGAEHVTQALERVQPGGRVVAIVGRGMAYGRPKLDSWWQKIEGKYTVRANVGIDGKFYGKYGTGFDNQIIVIDKIGPMAGDRAARLATVIIAENLSPSQAAHLLGPLGKEDIAERISQHAKQPRIPAPPRLGSSRSPGIPAPPAVDLNSPPGGGERGGISGLDGPPTGPPAVGTVEQSDVSGTGSSVAGGGVGPETGVGSSTDGSGTTAAVGSESGGGVPAGTGGDAGLKRGEQSKVISESEGNVFSKYVIRKATFANSVPHPANIVESATMASVEAPDVSYTPKLPEALVKSGKLSDVQLEAITYAGQRHQAILPNGRRAGYWIGDGTGVGKGREISGILYDNLQQGKKRAIWFSATAQLKVDAKRDMDGIGLPMNFLVHADTDMNDPLPNKDGVLFSTYSMAAYRWDAGRPRLEQMAKWAGPDFDGVIIYDESHSMKNAVMANMGGQVVQQAGKQEGTDAGAMGLALDEMFPKARIVYVSATGATVPRNMGYMNRLGLWGAGAPFASFMDFLGAMSDGGVGAMEMLSRDLKATGSYIARSISYNGVDYAAVEHQLTPDEIASYNELADVWSQVGQAFAAASAAAGSPKNAKGVISAFYGSQQRFFLQVQTSLQLPDLFKAADADLKEGRSVVISLYNTNEGQVAKKVAAAKAAGVDLEDLDFTPREILIDLVTEYFPVEQWTTKFDPVTQKDVPVQLTDEAGNPVINRANAEARDLLLDQIADIKVPDNPLDAIVNHFGAKNVAEVTGRKKRLEGGKYVARKIKDVPLKERDAMEVKRFQDGIVRVSIISGKASAGISLHASKSAANQDRRVFYAMQLSWSADKQMQSFGRVHRSDQTQPPILKMVLTNLKGQQRLVNTVAMRLASLGALTEGSRESKGGGLFALHDITDEYGVAALGRTYGDIGRDRMSGVTAGPQLLARMGLLNKDGNIRDADLANVERFLNRIMALHFDEQNAIFNHFFGIFESVVKAAKAAGRFDEGVQKIPAGNIQETAPAQLIHTDAASGARTTLLSLSGEFPSSRMSWDELPQQHRHVATDIPKRAVGFYRNKRSGRLYSSIQSKPGDYGETEHRLFSPKTGYGDSVSHEDLAQKFDEVSIGNAANEWNDAYRQVPEIVTKPIYLLNGAIFPIYDKVMGADGLSNPSVQRAELPSGQGKIGIRVLPSEIEALKQRLGIGTPLGQASSQQIYDLVKNHSIIELDNGWEIKSSRVHGESRLEINPGSRRVNKEEMQNFGVISETIDYSRRYFIPLEDTQGSLVISNILRVHKAVRDQTAITENPATTEEKEQKSTESYYVVPPAAESAAPEETDAEGDGPVTPTPIAGPKPMGRDYKFPSVLPKPPLTIGDRTYEPIVVKVAKENKLVPVSGWEVAPGLAVITDLDDLKQFAVTHTQSGMSARSHIHSAEMAIRIANQIAPMGDWTRSGEAINADKAFLAAVGAKLRELGLERGSIRLFSQKVPQKTPQAFIQSPPNIQKKLFDDPHPTINPWEIIKSFPALVNRRVIRPWQYNSDIDMWPIFSEMVRRFQEAPTDAATQAAHKLEEVLHGLDNSEFQVFSKIVYLEDVYETALDLGEFAVPLEQDPVTGQSVTDQLDSEINRLRGGATPETLKAVDNHHLWMEDTYKDLERRGKVDVGSGREKYFPNYIRRVGERMDSIPGLPFRMKDPARMYLKQRKGHDQAHDSNYIRAMEQYATRVNLDNMTDDFIQAVAETYDVRTGNSSEISTANRQEILQLAGKGFKPGDIFQTKDGKQFSVFQFSPGRVMYPVRAIKDYVIQDALNAGLQELGIDIDALAKQIQNSISGLPNVPQLETIMGEQLTTPAVAMGGQHKMYLLPREVTDKLKRFRESTSPNPAAEAMRVATKAFKVLALHTNVISWQVQNILSNNAMAMVEDLTILSRQKEAMDLLRGKLTGPQYDLLLELIHDARVWNSTFLGTGGTISHAINRPGLRPYRADVTRGISKINPLGDNPIGDLWRRYESGLRMVEGIPKVASFLVNYDRIMRGLPVRHVAVSLGGLDPDSLMAVGRVARELNGDYGAMNPNLRDALSIGFPFSPWFILIAPQVARALKDTVDPKTEIGKGIIFLLAMFLASYTYNHFHEWNTEKRLTSQKQVMHVNTGIHDEKGQPFIVSVNDPLSSSLQWVGLHTLSENMDRYMSGDLTAEQAAGQQLSDIFGFQKGSFVPTAPGALMERLLNPLIGTFTSLNANRDSYTGREIVSKSDPNLWGTLSRTTPDNPKGKELQRQYIWEHLLPIYRQWSRAEAINDGDPAVWNWITDTGPFTWRKLFGIRTANLDALDLNKWYDDMNWTQSQLDSNSREVFDAYLEYKADNIDAEELRRRLQPIMEKEGPVITIGSSLETPGSGTDLERMANSAAFQIKLNQALLAKAKDPAERAYYQDKIDNLRNTLHKERYQGLPKSVRERIDLPPVPGQYGPALPLVPAPAR